jgi:hypothetical protein
MPVNHEATRRCKVALAVQARYVSVSLLAEGNEGTRRICRVPSRRVRDAHREARTAHLDGLIQG